MTEEVARGSREYETPQENAAGATLDIESLERARAMTLDLVPMTDEARRLGAAIAEQTSAGSGRKRARRGKHKQEFDKAAATFAADLLKAAQRDRERWSRREKSAGSFSRARVSYRAFMQLFNGAFSAALIEQHKGSYTRFITFDDSSGFAGMGWTTRLRGTPKFFELASSCGVTPENVDGHFKRAKPREALVLKSSSARVGWLKVSGRSIRFDEDDTTRRLRSEIVELNDFLSEQEIVGGIHQGYRRIFNQGDLPSFRWNKGGRLYSAGEDSYQSLNKDRRVEMTFNGDGVVEIDIRASFLTILHSLKGLTFDPSTDPYEFDGFRRDVVKAWITATLGYKKFRTRWPQQAVADFRDEGINLSKAYPVKQVEAKVLERLPVLKNWPEEQITSFDLMFLESKAILPAMLRLMREHRVPSLSVHDSLIVAKPAESLASDILKTEYKAVCGAHPFLVVRERMNWVEGQRATRVPMHSGQGTEG
jgi:hypothetical protein